MMLTDSIKSHAEAHAAAEYPREACGLIITTTTGPVFVPCRNMAHGTDHFAIHPEDYAGAAERGEIVGVIHSHPDASANPSQADIVACEQSKLPWHIVGWPTGVWRSITPSGYVAPLLGRTWSHGVLDCLALIIDYHAQVLGVHVPDFERHDEWWYKGGNMYIDHHKAAGFTFVPTEDLRPNDVILMQVLADVPNHGAIYIGNNKVLHHLHKRVSCIDIYGGYWQRHTYGILRFSNADSETLRRISETVWTGI